MRDQSDIKVGAKGTEYRSWMSNPVFYVFGGCAVAAAVLAILFLAIFHIISLGVLKWSKVFAVYSVYHVKIQLNIATQYTKHRKKCVCSK